MKFLHLADLHLGKEVREMRMTDDQRDFLMNTVLPVVDERKVDAVVIAGDVYDQSVPEENAVTLFSDFLAELAKRGVETLIINGNHDSAKRLAFAQSLLAFAHVHIVSRYTGALESFTMNDEHGPVNFYFLPFFHRVDIASIYKEEKFATIEDAVAAVLARAPINTAERNVIIAHLFVTAGGVEPEKAGSERISESLGTIERVSSSFFDDFDYVALGHIHRAQKVGRETCRYAGSPLRYSLGEVEALDGVPYAKTMALVTMGAKGDVSVEKIPIKPAHEMIHYTDTFDNIIARGQKIIDDDPASEPSKDYIYATLTDKDTVINAMSRLRRVYPNAMSLRYAPRGRAKETAASLSVETKRTFEEIIDDFYREKHDKDGKMSDEEFKILFDAAREAGVVE